MNRENQVINFNFVAKVPTADKACKAILWPTPPLPKGGGGGGGKGTFDSPGFSAKGPFPV